MSNSQIRQNILKDICDHRRRDGSAVIDAHRLVDGDEGDDLRIVGRRKA